MSSFVRVIVKFSPLSQVVSFVEGDHQVIPLVRAIVIGQVVSLVKAIVKLFPLTG